MSNVTIAGGSTNLPVANSIDPSNDYLPIYTASALATQAINRNTLLGLASAPVGLTDSQTLTNKILTSPTINGVTLSGTLSGTYTIGGTPTFPSSVVQLTSSQTLTNKVLTSPTINAPTITNATISADTLSGFTSSTNGTVYGISVTGGQITNAAIANNTIGSTQIATNGVAAANLATNAITLGYAQITSNTTTTSTTAATPSVPLGVTVTIPSGGRRIKITVIGRDCFVGASSVWQLQIWDGTVGSGTLVGSSLYNNGGTSGITLPAFVQATVTPSAGSKTYNLGMLTSANTLTLEAGAAYPAFILVEAI